MDRYADDYIAKYGAGALGAILDAASDPVPPAGPTAGTGPNEAVDDPHRLARTFYASHGQTDSGKTLFFYRGEWHQWSGKAYKLAPVEEIEAAVTAWIKKAFDQDNENKVKFHNADNPKPPPTVQKVVIGLVRNTMNALKSLAILSSSMEAPQWLEVPSPFPPSECLPCQNAIIHLPSFVDQMPHYFVDPTPQFFSPNCLHFHFDPQAQEPKTWLQFLNQIWPNDPQSIVTLQQIFGYLLVPWTSLQKIFLIVGPPRSGKGTIFRILRALLGDSNVCAPTLSSLGTNFGLQPLVGKTAAMVSDARLSGKTDVQITVERLLSISGEDALSIPRKFLPDVTMQLKSRFLIATNELPRLRDASGALASRMILLQMTQSWLGKEDSTLTDRILNELPGILLWGIEGWRQLREVGRFTQPESCREILTELNDLASPISAFIRDCCTVALGLQVERNRLYSQWLDWCKSEGVEHPGDAAAFGRGLRANVPQIRDTQPRMGGLKVRRYLNIGLN